MFPGGNKFALDLTYEELDKILQSLKTEMQVDITLRSITPVEL
ncbi:hypothetical protein [Geoalkalibacter subterraneus]|nr:hypothetical protein [Geoalkalibacter subterraneus]